VAGPAWRRMNCTAARPQVRVGAAGCSSPGVVGRRCGPAAGQVFLPCGCPSWAPYQLLLLASGVAQRGRAWPALGSQSSCLGSALGRGQG
jgi:hypothetical protein